MTCGRTESPEWRKVRRRRRTGGTPVLTASRVPKVRRHSAMHAVCAGQSRPEKTRISPRAKVLPPGRSEPSVLRVIVFLS